MTGERTGGPSRRRVLAVAGATAASLGLAGCSSGGGGGGNGSTGGGGGGTGGSGTGGSGGGGGAGGSSLTEGLNPVDVDGQLTENTVDGIEVVGMESYEAVDYGMAATGAFVLHVTVRNTGDETTEPLGYTYDLSLYDEGGEELNQGYSARSFHHQIAPGETGTIGTWGGASTEAASVARYELAVHCEGQFADGVYCQ